MECPNMRKIIRDTIDGMFKYAEDYKRYYWWNVQICGRL